MIGQFSYSDAPTDAHVLLTLGWRDGAPAGIVKAPCHVFDEFGAELGLRQDDELVFLPIALGFAVIVATTAEVPLTITGDRSVWPPYYGLLTERPHPTQSH